MAVAAKDAGPGLDRAELKKALVIARRQPMHCAFALGGDGKPVILIDKIKKGPGLDRDLKSKAPDTKNHRFGVVEIDKDNPKLCRFTINKAGTGGMARKLIVALKGTGFNKVLIQLEDGTAVESEEGEDEETGDEVAAAGQAGSEENGGNEPAPATANANPASPPEADNQSQAAAAPAAQPAAGTQQVAGPDAASLTADLTALVKKMVAAIAADPTKKSALAELAVDAQASLKRGDLQGASAGIDVLREALDSAGDANGQPSPASGQPLPASAQPAQAGGQPSTNGASQAAPAPNGSAPPDASATAATIAKARTAWTATRQKVQGDLGKLHDQFGSAFKGHEQEDQITKAFRDRVGTVLDALDEGLADALDSVNKAKDPGERAQLVQQARTLLQKYQQHVATDPTIAALDSNPFVPLAVAKTMSATIDALSRSIR
jgi:hypothetical protein